MEQARQGTVVDAPDGRRKILEGPRPRIQDTERTCKPEQAMQVLEITQPWIRLDGETSLVEEGKEMAEELKRKTRKTMELGGVRAHLVSDARGSDWRDLREGEGGRWRKEGWWTSSAR